MAATKGEADLPTRSQLEAWEIAHLVSAARHWLDTAVEWERSFVALHQAAIAPGGTEFDGATAEAIWRRTHSDMVTVVGLSDALQMAAKAATSGADKIAAAKSVVLDSIRQADEAGFDVGEDLSLTSREEFTADAEYDAKLAQAYELAREIRTGAAILRNVDGTVAETIGAAVASFAGVGFLEPSQVGSAGSVHAVTWKQGPNMSPLPEPGAGGGGSETSEDRRRNQIAAFEQAFGRAPISVPDWTTAAALDPHSYGDKTNGVPPNIVMGRINKVPGAGVAQTNAFIGTETAEIPGVLTNAGDNRGFDVHAAPDQSRVSFVVDYENGIVVARQNPSVLLDDGSVLTGRPEISVGQQSDGNVHIKFNAADPFTPVLGEGVKKLGVSVDGDLYFQPSSDGAVRVGGHVSEYPMWEINHYAPDGSATALVQERPAWDHPASLAWPLSKTIGDTAVISGHSVIPAPPQPADPFSGPARPQPVPIGPEVVAVPLPTTPLGPVSAPPSIPVTDPVLILPNVVPR